MKLKGIVAMVLGWAVPGLGRTSSGAPDKTAAKAVVHACEERGLLLLTCGPWDNTIRWIPPLVVNESQVNQALDIFTKSLAETNLLYPIVLNPFRQNEESKQPVPARLL